MKIETRIYEDKTIIPSKFLKKYDLRDDDVVVWNENENGTVIITFRKNS